MFNRRARFLVSTAISYGLAMNAMAVGQGGGSMATGGSTSSPGIYSILNKEQVKENKDNRIFFNQDVAHTVDSDPIFPYRASPIYSFVGGEHFFTPEFSLGLVITYTYEKDKYTKNQTGVLSSDTVARVGGFLPYVNYLVSRNWLLTGQVGGYVEEYKDTSVTTAGPINSREQVFTPNAEGYLTWIGPDRKVTASVRGGGYYSNQRFRFVKDSAGNMFATRHFESAAVAVSARLKYYPDDTFWNAFVHMETDYRFFAGSRPGVFHPDNGRNTMLYQIGPGMHFKLSDTWELRVLALHTIGFGYSKEERIGIRLRAAI